MGPRHMNPVTFFDGKGPDNRPVAVRLADAEFEQKAPEIKTPASTLPKTTDHQAPPTEEPEQVESGRDPSSVAVHPSQLPAVVAPPVPLPDDQ